MARLKRGIKTKLFKFSNAIYFAVFLAVASVVPNVFKKGTDSNVNQAHADTPYAQSYYQSTYYTQNSYYSQGSYGGGGGGDGWFSQSGYWGRDGADADAGVDGDAGCDGTDADGGSDAGCDAI